MCCLVLTGEPLLIVSPSPPQCSDAVIGLVSLVSYSILLMIIQIYIFLLILHIYHPYDIAAITDLISLYTTQTSKLLHNHLLRMVHTFHFLPCA
jgi:hypothetical protein